MNAILHGHDPTPHYVAAQQLSDTQIRLYGRDHGKISHVDVDFFPFFFLSDPSLLKGFDRKHWLKDLAGTNHFNFLAVFTRWTDVWEAVRLCIERHRDNTRERIETVADAGVLYFRPDPVGQYLMQSGVTLFKGLVFEDLNRLQVSFATHSSARGVSNAQKTEDGILALALSDTTGWNEVLDARKTSERELLRRFMELIQEKDPDVIEGHNLFGHDLPYLTQRCSLHEIPLAIGRDGSDLKTFSSRWGGSESEQDSPLFEIAGRHLIDTQWLSEVYDFSKRSLEGLDLHTLASHFSADMDSRVIIPPSEIPRTWSEDPKKLHAFLTQNIQDIDLISRHLSQSSFYLTQMVPMSFGTVARTGSAVKIESLLVREYLRRKHSIPQPQRGTQTTGGYADLYRTGIFESVVLADVESLYPSIMVGKNIRPASDVLAVFPELLKDLMAMRLKAKRAMTTSKRREIRARHDAMQTSFKILINSFYGYLGYARGIFNDYGQADVITKTGQELLRTIVRTIELYNGNVLEVDTDGVFFIPPDNVSGREQEDSLVQRISDSLPEGIHLVASGRYRKMMSYKKKNYALLEYGGSLIVKGSSLIARSMERFLRRFLRLAISNLLDNNIAGLHELYGRLRSDIVAHRWEVLDFCRTETIHDPFPVYEREIGEGRRNPAAAYEVSRLAGRIVKPGDKVSYYVTGTTAGVKISENCRLAEEWDPNFADENTAYYLARLEEASQKFEVFFKPEDFRNIFTGEDLFGFDPAGISTVQKRVAGEADTPSLLDDQERLEFRIWLGER